MITEERIEQLILEAMEIVKNSDPVYKDWILNKEAIVFGASSPMDSVAYTIFITELEGKIEDELKRVCTLDIEHLYGDDDPAELNLTVIELARRIPSMLDSTK